MSGIVWAKREYAEYERIADDPSLTDEDVARAYEEYVNAHVAARIVEAHPWMKSSRRPDLAAAATRIAERDK